MKSQHKTFLWVLFCYYLLLLLWIILYKMCFSFADLDRMRLVNWIPFAQSTFSDGRINRSEIILNVLLFVPFGVYVSLLRPAWHFFRKLLPAFCMSLACEVLQYAFAIGVSDVTDLMGNTLGGAIGILLYAFLHRRCKNGARLDRALTAIAAVGSACVTALLLLLLLSN